MGVESSDHEGGGEDGLSALIPAHHTVHVDRDDVPECRICKCGEEEGTLIRACRCRGSCQFVHSACLQKWLEQRPGGLVRAREGEMVVGMCCEVCNSPYTIRIVQQTHWTAERLLSSRSCEAYFECTSLVVTLAMFVTMPYLLWNASSALERQTLVDNWPLLIITGLCMVLMAIMALRKVFVRWRRAQSTPVISPLV